MLTRLETFVKFGYKIDPFYKVRFETGDLVRFRKILTMAVESRAMMSVIGERGIGKTELVKMVLAKLGVRVVTVEKSDKERVTISDIERATILDLGEKPLAGGETRSRQFRPVVGEASRKDKVVLVLEEAQRLHGATLKSLKTLREKTWMGESELFTVILIAQSDPMARAGLSEVKLRTDSIYMQGLSSDEAAGYVKLTLGKNFEPAAIEALAEFPQAANFLELQELCIVALNRALAANRTLVSLEDIRSMSSDTQTDLPRPAARGKAPAIVTGSDALKSVLGLSGGTAGEKKGATAC